jgi:hypothetical protein
MKSTRPTGRDPPGTTTRRGLRDFHASFNWTSILPNGFWSEFDQHLGSLVLQGFHHVRRKNVENLSRESACLARGQTATTTPSPADERDATEIIFPTSRKMAPIPGRAGPERVVDRMRHPDFSRKDDVRARARGPFDRRRAPSENCVTENCRGRLQRKIHANLPTIHR